MCAQREKPDLLTNARTLAASRHVAFSRGANFVPDARLASGLRRFAHRRFQREYANLAAFAILILFALGIRPSKRRGQQQTSCHGYDPFVPHVRVPLLVIHCGHKRASAPPATSASCDHSSPHSTWARDESPGVGDRAQKECRGRQEALAWGFCKETGGVWPFQCGKDSVGLGGVRGGCCWGGCGIRCSFGSGRWSRFGIRGHRIRNGRARDRTRRSSTRGFC